MYDTHINRDCVRRGQGSAYDCTVQEWSVSVNGGCRVRWFSYLLPELVSFSVLPQRAGICVPLVAAWMQTGVGLLVKVRLLVLGTVGRVGERLVAVLAHVRLLPRVGAQVDLEVLEPRERLRAARELQGGREGGGW